MNNQAVEPRILSLVPPMTQLNTPYPSTAYITGFLRANQFIAHQQDLSIALVLELLSSKGLHQLHQHCLLKSIDDQSKCVKHFLKWYTHYLSSIDTTIRFLQGQDPTLAYRIASRTYLPEGPRFDPLDEYEDIENNDPLAWAFGSLGTQDKARHIATLYLNDLADVIRDSVDSRFEFVRYAESLAASQPHFDSLAQALNQPRNYIDSTLSALTLASIERYAPTIVLLSVPFPGSVYGAFRIAQTIKQHHPNMIIVLGGGFVNTELRQLAEPRVFDFFDYVTLDAGERPLLALLDHLKGKRSTQRLVRTFHLVNGTVQYTHWNEPDVPFDEVGTPTWDGLPLAHYLSLLDMLNPMHRLWSDGRWNKLTVAHGCYWKKCSFCDVGLDYISRYDAASAKTLVDRVQTIVQETGQTGFHLVDEAAPPKSLKAFAAELQARHMSISWWGNIRFEKTFTPDLCISLADSGCIAVSGGLEVASDRLLKLMNKGVSVAQVARVTKAFSDASILVHAYLMYGFPTQTVQETVDALEYVRQLFLNQCISSAYFHRFTCTVHSPVGLKPADYGITLQALEPGLFAKNDVKFIDPTNVDHAALGLALNKALYNYMHGIGLELSVRQWFNERVPKPTVAKNYIELALLGKL